MKQDKKDAWDMHDKVPLKNILSRKKINRRFFLEKNFSSKNNFTQKKSDCKRQSEASYYAYHKASFTLEMVIIMPLFICFLVFFLFLFRVLQVQECMEEVLQGTSRVLAVECYEQTPEKRGSQAELLAQAGILLIKNLKEAECPVGYIQGGMAGISLLESDLQGEEIILRARYAMNFPIGVFGNRTYHIYQCSESRKWIGDITLGDGTEDEKWVYITPAGAAYHTTNQCPYLDLSIRMVSSDQLSGLRNASGGKYRSCESCGKKEHMVYVTDYGDRYHSSLSCSGLKRTVYMVKITDVGGRHLCSKCGSRQQS